MGQSWKSWEKNILGKGNIQLRASRQEGQIREQEEVSVAEVALESQSAQIMGALDALVRALGFILVAIESCRRGHF